MRLMSAAPRDVAANNRSSEITAGFLAAVFLALAFLAEVFLAAVFLLDALDFDEDLALVGFLAGLMGPGR